MSLPHPPAQAPTSSRPRTATIGAVMAVVMSSLGAFVGVVGLLAAAFGGDDGDPTGRRDAAVTFGVLLPLALVGLTAAVMALRNSNGWRITTIVFGFLTSSFWAIAAAGAFLSNDRGATVGGVLLVALALISIAPAVLLLVNGANAFYSRSTPVPTAYAAAPRPAPALPPAGWYPTDGSRLRWWNGTQWTEHFHDGAQP